MSIRPVINRIAAAAALLAATAAPAVAQTPAATTEAGGPSLLWVWGWILVAGVIIFIVGTSLGVRGRR